MAWVGVAGLNPFRRTGLGPGAMLSMLKFPLMRSLWLWF